MNERLTHVPDHHNGECIYCRGFSYEDPWWDEICVRRIEFEREQILRKPDVIRSKIEDLRKELKEAVKAAKALK